jgi:hypothetical protein
LLITAAVGAVFFAGFCANAWLTASCPWRRVGLRGACPLEKRA